jgi:hypothetical protein
MPLALKLASQFEKDVQVKSVGLFQSRAVRLNTAARPGEFEIPYASRVAVSKSAIAIAAEISVEICASR